MENRILTEEESESNRAKKEEDKESKSSLTKTVKKVADFDFNISKNQVLAQIPFMAYVFLLLMAFIYNGHQIEKKIRETDHLNKEIKEFRSEYISVLSELMSESKQSTVAKKLEKSGIKQLKNPPRKITLNGN